MLIYEALKEDHETVKDLLRQLLMLADGDDNRKDLIQKIHDELIPHARAEEAVFYNSLRSLDAAKDIIMHAYGEHIEAEVMLTTLQVKDKIDADWRKTALKLKQALEHHIKEEETRIFNVAKELFTSKEAIQLGEAFEKMKSEVKGEGFVGTTLDLIKNLMPPRFVQSFRGQNWTTGLNR